MAAVNIQGIDYTYDDMITAKTEGSTVSGNSANNYINLNDESLVIDAKEGDDLIVIEGGKTTINAGAGNDIIDNTGNSNSKINGGAGDDLIYAGNNDTLTGGAGNDTFVYQTGKGDFFVTDFSNNGSDSDMVSIQSGTLLDAKFSGKNYVMAVGADSITLQNINQKKAIHIVANGNSSIISTSSQNYSSVNGSTADDFISAEGTNDTIYGDTGNDTIQVGGIRNSILAGAGADSILSSGTANTIIAGVGDDVVALGTNNLYVYNSNDGADVISSFDSTATLNINDVISNVESISGDSSTDVKLSTSGGSITLVNAINKVFTVTNSVGSVYSALHDGDNLINLVSNTVKEATVKGNSGFYSGAINDSINNTGAAASIAADTGDDIIITSGASVTADGGAGDDLITNKGTRSLIIGGDGADSIVGSGTYSTINAGSGDDTVSLVADYNVLQFDSVAGDNLVYGFTNRTSIQLIDGRDINGGIANETDVTLQSANTNITLIGGKGKIVNIVDSDGNRIRSQIFNSGTTLNLTYIDSSDTSVAGTSDDEYFIATVDKVTISPAEGNDTIELNRSTITSGSVIEYEGGADIISGINGSDTIVANITNFLPAGVKTSGNNVTLLFGNGIDTDNSIIFKDGKSVQINLNGSTDTALYNGALTLAGTNNDDEFKFAAGFGNLTINDYKDGDVLKLLTSDTQIVGAAQSSGNVTLTVGNSGIGVGKIFLNNASDTKLNIVNHEDVSLGKQVYGLTSIDVIGSDGDTIDTSYNSKVVTINASSDTLPVHLIGNALGNVLYGGDDENTLQGGSGNDTYFGGGEYTLISGKTTLTSDDAANTGGTTTYLYSAGNDVIVGYNRDDSIKFAATDTNITSYAISGNDVKFSLSNRGKILIKNGRNKRVVFVGGEDGTTVISDTVIRAVTDLVVTESGTGTVSAVDNSKITLIDANSEYTDSEPLYLLGNANANTILAANVDSTLDGGADTKADTLVGSDGADTFIYKAGSGNDVIVNYDYVNGDVIRLGSSDTKLTKTALNTKTGDVTFTFNKGAVVVKGKGKDDNGDLITQKIKIVDHNGDDVTTPQIFGTSTLIVDSTNYTDSVFDGTYNTALKNIDASGNSNITSIVGNSGANSIVADGGPVAGSGLTLVGGAGNDTLTGGGDGTNVYAFDSVDGTDVITNYTVGDKIKILGGALTAVDTVKNTDNLIMTIGKTKVTLKDAKDKAITVVDKDGNETTQVYGTSTRTVDDSSGATIDINNESKVVTIDASARTTDVVLIGNAAHNKIITSTDTGTAASTIIKGGKGNDTITFTPANSNSLTITDYTAGQDIIQLTGGASVSAAAMINDSDVTLTILGGSNTGTITIKNAATTKNNVTTYNKITIADDAGDKTAMAYGTPSISVANADGATIDVARFSTITTIDAAKRSTNVVIVGNNAGETIKGGTKNDVIYAGSGDNFINVGAGNDTIYSGSGKNTITGAAGKDYFVYGAGEDTITDYATAQDVIKFTDSTTVSSYTIENKDLIFTLNNRKTLTLQNVITTNARTGVVTGKKITIEDKDGKAISQIYGATDLTVINADVASEGTLNLSAAWNTDVKNVTAASRSYAINIAGNDNDNKLIGGKGADTLTGGSGDDTLTGGAGNDIFVYDGSGADVITDYTLARNNSDTIRFTATITDYDYRIEGKDVIFYDTNDSETNTLKVTNGKDKVLQIVDDTGAAATIGTPSGGAYNDYTEIILPSTGSSPYSAETDTRLITINASKRNKNNPIYITGNDNANIITGSAGADTINGKGGNDTITTGAGKDTIIYESDKIVITDYTAGQDVINIGSASITSVTANEADAIFKIDNTDSAITIKNAFTYNKTKQTQTAAKKITFSNGTTSTSQVYGFPVMTVVNADVSANATINLNDAANAAITTVNAKALAATLPVDIVGHSSGVNHQLIGGAGADTLTGGSGDDTLTGNKGSDTFVYTSGNDVITDYTANADVVTLGSGLNVTATEYVKNSKGKVTADVKLTIGTAGTLTLKNGKNKTVTITDGNNTTTNLIYGENAATQAVTSSTQVTAGGLVKILTGASNKASVPVDIVASADGSTLIGGAGADTLTGSTGADYFTGNKGSDTFITGAGLDTISDYTVGQDIVSLSSGQVTNSTISGSNILLTVGGSNSNVISVLKAKGKKITVADTNGTSSLIYGNGAATMAFAAADTDTTFNATSYDLVKVINGAAMAATKPLTLRANSSGNTVTGGKGADTIYSGAGADYLKGGAGNDVYVYGGGADTIADYTAGQDSITLGSGQSVSVSAIVENAKGKKNDILLTIDEGKTIRVTNGINKRITVNDVTLIYGNDAATLNVSNADGATIDTSDMNLPTYAKAIDAAKRTTAVEIVGNATATVINGGTKNDTITGGSAEATINGGAGNDSIIGGSTKTTINGGKGNDYLTGGAGADYFYYTNGDGNDVIKDFDADNDYIVLGAKTTLNTVKSGLDANNKDYTLIVGSGSIQLLNVEGKQIKVYTTPTSTEPIEIDATASSARVADFVEEMDDELLADDKFINDANSGTELETILNSGGVSDVTNDKLYNTSVDAMSISQVSTSVLNKTSKK